MTNFLYPVSLIVLNSWLPVTGLILVLFCRWAAWILKTQKTAKHLINTPEHCTLGKYCYKPALCLTFFQLSVSSHEGEDRHRDWAECVTDTEHHFKVVKYVALCLYNKLVKTSGIGVKRFESANIMPEFYYTYCEYFGTFLFLAY